jgi:hypothetical protein
MSSDETIWLLGVLPEASMSCNVTQYSLQKVLVEGLGVTPSQLRVFLAPLIDALNLNLRKEASLADLSEFLDSTGFLKLSTNVSSR